LLVKFTQKYHIKEEQVIVECNGLAALKQ